MQSNDKVNGILEATYFSNYSAFMADGTFFFQSALLIFKSGQFTGFCTSIFAYQQVIII